MKFLLLEDDNNWASDITSMIKSSFSMTSIQRIASEWDFRKRINQLAAGHFDVAIFDVMLGWATVDEVMDRHALVDIPSEVSDELEGKAKSRAGIRCCRLLGQKIHQLDRLLPAMLFYTVVEENDLERHPCDPPAVYLEKSRDDSNPSSRPLVDAIHKALLNRKTGS